MSDPRGIENAHAEREALHAVPTRSPGSGDTVRAALKRYVTSEQYREQSRRSTQSRVTATKTEK